MRIEIKEIFNDKEEVGDALGFIAELIKKGYTAGLSPNWKIKESMCQECEKNPALEPNGFTLCKSCEQNCLPNNG